MKRRWMIILVVMAVVIMVLVGCAQEERSSMEIKHEDVIDQYDHEHTKRLKMFETASMLRVYKLNNEETGFIVAQDGYEEEILVYARLDENEVREIEILYEVESEKYGEYVDERWFLDRLLLPINKTLVTTKYKKEMDNEVIAITGATITSDAVVLAVNQCIEMKNDLTN